MVKIGFKYFFLSNNVGIHFVLVSHTSFSTGSSGLSGITPRDGTKWWFIPTCAWCRIDTQFIWKICNRHQWTVPQKHFSYVYIYSKSYNKSVRINHHLVPSLGVIPLNPLEPVEKDVWESSTKWIPTLLDQKINPIRYCEKCNHFFYLKAQGIKYGFNIILIAVCFCWHSVFHSIL
jgi:hypothetical protein